MKQFAQYLDTLGEIGTVEEIFHSMAYVNGLPGAHTHELVVSETGNIGQIISLKQDIAEVLFFSANPSAVKTKVARTGEFLQVGLSTGFLGKTLNPFCQAITGILPHSSESRRIFSTPAGIQKRKLIHRHFETGVSAVDLMLPLGKGQRQLVIGDRKTGKTDFLLKTIETQAEQGTICIYVAIGKRILDIKKIEEQFAKAGLTNQTIIVAAGSDQPASVIYITPYTAMTIAEFFKDQGRDVLIVFDDLSTHAKFYREISLLSKRFPGRNSYPGDMFYAHAQLLERAGNFSGAGEREVSITCMPVIETIEGDLVGYIQTNLISMTDGHLYFDNDLFANGRRPAINPFLSVTRVGNQTQTPLMRDTNRELTSFLALYEKMQGYTHFGAEVTENVAQNLLTGERVIAFLNQERNTVIPLNLQIFLFALVWTGTWQKATVAQMKQQINEYIHTYLMNEQVKKTIDEVISQTKSLNSLIGQVISNAQQYKDLFNQTITKGKKI